MNTKGLSRRDVLRLGALTAGGAALAGCGLGTETPGATSPAVVPATAVPATAVPQATSGPYQGRFVIMSLAPANQNSELIKGIEDGNPGIIVDWRGFRSDRFVELFAAAEVGGEQIDILDLNGQDLRRYALAGKLVDLSDSPLKDRIREAGLRTYTVRDKLWALARGGISGFTFLYNKKPLKEIGFTDKLETYDQLKQIAPELAKIGVAPFTAPGKNIYMWPIWHFFAYCQTSGGKPVENTLKTLGGEMKFTDPEHVAALEILYNYGRDGMFISGVNSLDNDAAQLNYMEGKALMWYWHTSVIGLVYNAQGGQAAFPNLDLDLMPPLASVAGAVRGMPGGTGDATGIYSKIAPERMELAKSILDLMTSDKWVKWRNERDADPVSTNKNVQASNDPFALEYAADCAPYQFTYLDWYWPPEVTRAFQENQAALVAGTTTPDKAGQAIQDALDGLYAGGYKFEL